MATLTVKCKRGVATVETVEGETEAQVAVRLAEAIKHAGGRIGERVEKPRAKTRDEQMAERGLIECKGCGVWVRPTRWAAERHNTKHHSESARVSA